MKQPITKHGKVFLFDMDLRDAWFKHSSLSRALLVSYKWRVTHATPRIVHRATA